MIRFALAFALSLLSGAVFAQCSSTSYGNSVTCVQASGQGGCNPTCSNNTVSLSPTAGHAVVVVAYQCWDTNCATTGSTTLSIGTNLTNPSTEPCFTKSPSSPFTLVETSTGAQHLQEYIWYCPSIPSGVTQFFIYCSVANSCSYITSWASEWTGLTSTTGSGAYDGDGGAASTVQNTTSTCTTSTGIYTNVLTVGATDNTNDESMTPTSPALQINQFFAGNLKMGITFSAAGAHSLVATWTGNDDWYTACANIKSASSVGGGPTNLRGVPGVDRWPRYWFAELMP